jgi:RNA polymerase sigma-70 factor (ECF subfamily)
VDVEMIGDRMTADTPDRDFGIDFVQALTILKEEERTAVLLFFMEDQPIDKIAKIMGCPSGTVKSHLHRGKEKLAVYFRNY